jgi:16S rRNA (uracil1498-N3)-methyltransferase
MSAPVFLADAADLGGESVVLAGSEGRHAATVRRIRPGERVDLTDGAGLVAECEVSAVRAGELELRVRRRRFEPSPEPRITVIQAIPKGDRGELAVEMMTEVGVDVVVPWAAERCVARWRGDRAVKPLARWRAAARESAKQARRAWIPQVTDPASTAAAARRAGAAARAVVLDQAAQRRLADVPVPRAGEIVIVAGPEGGLTADETAAFAAAGAEGARLGPAVLRTSTAATVAAAVLLSRSGRW